MSTMYEDGINEELVDSESYSPLYKRGLEEKTLDLLASEVYLLEQWSDVPEDKAQEQHDRIMNQWIDLGCSGRHPYHIAALKHTYPPPTDVQRTTVLSPWRTPQERQAALILTSQTSRLWLRTNYSPGHNPLSALDENEKELITGAENNTLVFNDASLYDFSKDWFNVLLRIPEILDSYHGPKNGPLHSSILRTFEEPETEVTDPKVADEADSYRDLEHASITGCLWVQDEKSPRTGKVLLMWVDDLGKVIRWNRMTTQEIVDAGGMFAFGDGRELDGPMWEYAQYGHDYGWE
ncbi:hypothetical protein D6C98_05425 [Aureobasidium pullulans]|nr:hypothetical protein D6C98_05425 [Aureobasidium pullulans]